MMGLYQAICPCCGHVNKHLYLEETEGFFECEACGQVSFTQDYMTDTSSGDEIKKLKKAMTGAIFPTGEPYKKAV